MCAAVRVIVLSAEVECCLCVIRAKVQGTFIGRYFTAGGQWNYGLNGVRYSEHYVEDTSQQVDSGIAA